MRFRAADGASYEGRNDEGQDMFKVSIPLDEHGYFGRQCPSCEQVFRINHDDYGSLPDDLVLWCAYCGHRADHGEFMTQQQQDRIMRVAQDAGTQMISEALDHAFGSMARSTHSSSSVRVTYRSKPFYPEPLPDIDEEKLIRQRQCPDCNVRYAVFGDHRFCPVSGPLNAHDVSTDALAAEAAKLDLLGSIPPEQSAVLREQGLFDRLYVSTLGSVVGIVETLAGSVFRSHMPNAADLIKGKGNVFQRLDDLADLFSTNLNIEVRTATGVDWPTLTRLWAARHVHTHTDGLVDERYLRAVPASTLTLGQRVIVSEADARLAVAQATELCDAFAPAPVDML